MNLRTTRTRLVLTLGAFVGLCLCALSLPRAAVATPAEQRLGDAAVAGQLPPVPPKLLPTPLTERIDIVAQPLPENSLEACHLVGQVTLWVSRPLRVLDDVQHEQAVIEAGLLQFGAGSRLEGCAPDFGTLDLSEQFANFVVAERHMYHRGKATAVASRLARGLLHFAHVDGAIVPLVAGLRARARSGGHEYTILLIRDSETAEYDAVIHRGTAHIGFSPRLPDSKSSSRPSQVEQRRMGSTCGALLLDANMIERRTVLERLAK